MELDPSDAVRDLEAQVQELQLQLRSLRSEMYARTKNTYQVIAAMLEMVVMDGPLIPAEEIHAVGRRLNVIALIHDIVMRSESTPALVRLPVLLTELSRLLHHAPATAWTLEFMGDDLWLNQRQATALGLMLCEWQGTATQRRGDPLSVATTVGPDQVIMMVSPIAHNVANNSDDSLADIVLQHDLNGKATYQQKTDGSWQVELHVRCELFPAAPSL